MKQLRAGFIYGLSFVSATILGTMLIIVGNDLLIAGTSADSQHELILRLDYAQWLPVTACYIALSSLGYLLLVKLPFQRMNRIGLALLSGLLALAVVLLSSGSFDHLYSYDWYHVKNMTAFFLAGFAFAILSELLD